ncbi:UvrD-helicase domain-containing protein [Phaeobacter italicus]|uniref:UvrD-helicase domain-containing protein n=2 Tax=Phaeobacter italicus TaxID=481446 RepID=UPI00232C85F0|nr:UvrD-helicase domain-containing protein [Phaeobacter italicus]
MTIELSPAHKAAQEAQERVEQCLEDERSFRLEAGAGAGKTYSLVEALKKIISERGKSLIQAGQQVACITYTEVARDEIARDIAEHPAILVNTIHGFGWSFISRFQKELRSLVAKLPERQEAIEQAGGISGQRVDYSFGFFSIDEEKIMLSHDDVPRFLAAMLSNEKTKRIFKSNYPILFIDEYQDTDPSIMESLSANFFEVGDGPVVGLFGDHWQTIYRKDFELAEFENVEGIDKKSNFRSVPPIVNVLNRLRPELAQEVEDPQATGEARFFHCNGYTGDRVSTAHAKNELPEEEHARAIERMREHLVEEGWDFSPENTKVLMLTHNSIAAKQGYPNLARIFKRNEAFAKKEDATISFLLDTVEPLCLAFSERRYGEMFRLLGKAPTIQSVADKEAWRHDMETLIALRQDGTVGQVIDHLKDTGRPRLNDKVAAKEKALAEFNPDGEEEEPTSSIRQRELRETNYSEIIAVEQYVSGSTPFATQHSVKGAQFPNVLVILSGGWNQYNWPRLLEQIHTGQIPAKQRAGYYRARNLLYVALSRPKKRLAVLATQELSADALLAAESLFTTDMVLGLPFEA